MKKAHASLEALDANHVVAVREERLGVDEMPVPEELALVRLVHGEIEVLELQVVDLVLRPLVGNRSPTDADQLAVQVAQRERDAHVLFIEADVELLEHRFVEAILFDERRRTAIEDAEESFRELGILEARRTKRVDLLRAVLVDLFEDELVVHRGLRARDPDVPQERHECAALVAGEAVEEPLGEAHRERRGVDVLVKRTEGHDVVRPRALHLS